MGCLLETYFKMCNFMRTLRVQYRSILTIVSLLLILWLWYDYKNEARNLQPDLVNEAIVYDNDEELKITVGKITATKDVSKDVASQNNYDTSYQGSAGKHTTRTVTKGNANKTDKSVEKQDDVQISAREEVELTEDVEEEKEDSSVTEVAELAGGDEEDEEEEDPNGASFTKVGKVEGNEKEEEKYPRSVSVSEVGDLTEDVEKETEDLSITEVTELAGDEEEENPNGISVKKVDKMEENEEEEEEEFPRSMSVTQVDELVEDKEEEEEFPGEDFFTALSSRYRLRGVDCAALLSGDKQSLKKTQRMLTLPQWHGLHVSEKKLMEMTKGSCEEFKKQRGYITSVLSQQEKQFPLAYR